MLCLAFAPIKPQRTLSTLYDDDDNDDDDDDNDNDDEA